MGIGEIDALTQGIKSKGVLLDLEEGWTSFLSVIHGFNEVLCVQLEAGQAPILIGEHQVDLVDGFIDESLVS